MDIHELIQRAVSLGATDAAVVDASEIRVSEELAKICKTPGCPFHGQSASCPPHVGGPEAFQEWVRQCPQAIVVRIDLPSEVLYSERRLEVMAFLHELVAGIETSARSSGYKKSKAFAGGSCKELFCSSHADCRYILSDEGCRNPNIARPSMSGFGVDVGFLMTLANWDDKELLQNSTNGQKMSWIAGLILIG